MKNFSPDACHEYVLKNRKQLLAFDPSVDYADWKTAVKEKFCELLGDDPERVELNIEVEWEKERDTYIERRIVFDAEVDASVPCHLLLPKTGKKPYPVVICLQGHTPGMHVSLGRTIYDRDFERVSADDDFALQVIREGYAALVLEQRGFGERRCTNRNDNTTCDHPAMVAALLGRTLIRERAWDVSRAIDMLETLPEIDKDHIALMGNSGGGTATYYTAALEPRIKVAMPSCSVCAFEHSIGIMRHCDCNYIPRMAKYFDMGEVACLIAPRPLIVVAGERDTIFRIEGVRQVYKVIEEIYKKEEASGNCKLIVGAEGHRFYGDLSWDTFRTFFLGK